jgi:hypothetical protein
MARITVVLDTDLYRSLDDITYRTLVTSERNYGALGRASYSAATELLADIASAELDGAERAIGSLRRLVERCVQFDGAERAVRFTGDFEARLARLLFDTDVIGREDARTNFGRLVGQVGTIGNLSELARFRPTLQQLRDQHLATEDAFLRFLGGTVVDMIAPEAESWDYIHKHPDVREKMLSAIDSGECRQILAVALVVHTARASGKEVDEDKLPEQANTVAKTFPKALHFFDAVLRALVTRGPEAFPPGRINAVWDYAIAFSPNDEETIEGMPVWLVTDDAVLLDAAARADANNVKSLSAYQAAIANDDQ